MRDDALDLLPQTEPAPRQVPGAAGLAFAGFKVSWDARLSDPALLTSLAESWEGTFNHWSRADESLHIGHSALGYCVDFEPGSAKFSLQIPDLNFPLANRHILALTEFLKKHGRGQASVSMTAQFLYPDDREFADLVTALSDKLLGETFFGRIGASLNDLSYLVDVAINGQWFQLSAGPVRASEVHRHVASTKIARVPDVSLFLSVTTRWSLTDAPEAFQAQVRTVFNVSETIAKELRT